MKNENFFEELKSQFNNRIKLHQRRDNIYQILLPIYYEDGDMIDIFLDFRNSKSIKLTDFGMTLMHLSYEFEIDTENKNNILLRILSENHLEYADGVISCDVEVGSLFNSIMHFSQVVGKISSLSNLKKESVKSLFMDYLDDYVMKDLVQYHPKKNFTPIEEREEFKVDYRLSIANKPSVYLFGITSNDKALFSALCCLHFITEKIPFYSCMIYDDFHKLTQKNQRILMNDSDKQYWALDDFRKNGHVFLDRVFSN